jgi:hypothetical protein
LKKALKFKISAVVRQSMRDLQNEINGPLQHAQTESRRKRREEKKGTSKLIKTRKKVKDR